MKRFFALILMGCFFAPAYGHKASDSYLRLTANDAGITGEWDIALRDLEYALGLDTNDDGDITWGELRARQAEIARYAFARLRIHSDGAACPLEMREQQVDRHSDGAYTVLRFDVRCAQAPEQLQIAYRLFFDLDPQHRGLLKLAFASGTTSGVFEPKNSEQIFTVSGQQSWSRFGGFFALGAQHIAAGFDHLLFLVALLLPAVLWRTQQGWQPVTEWRTALIDTVRIVTAFTAAHSVTLSLAALGMVSLPSRLIEAAIAASVILAALNNVFPRVHKRLWMVAFGFGLIHGFGFATALTDLGLSAGARVASLAGFNLGVEAGQLLVVVVVLPIIYAVRTTLFYRRAVFTGGSLAVAALACVWLVERVFDVRVLA